MTKSELIQLVAQRTGVTRAQAELVVKCVFTSMAESLAAGDGIEVRGFGSFSVREYDGYTGVNPRTHQPVKVAPKRLPFFRVGKELRERVNARAGTPMSADDGDDRDDGDDSDD
jgi:integration host factor subunit beta